MSSYPVGRRVHVEFDGKIVEPYYAGSRNLIGDWIEVEDDVTGCTNVLWMIDSSDAVTLLPEPEPDYRPGSIWRDAYNIHYLRADGYWWAFGSAERVGHSTPRRPLQKLSA